MRRLMKSYEFMLHFYGCKLKNQTSGEIERHENYRKQYDNLNDNYHNNLRITRILKCLGEFGYEQHKIAFLNHCIKEIYEEDELSACSDSLEKYWIGAVKDDDIRDDMIARIQEYQEKEKQESGHTKFDTGKTYNKNPHSAVAKSTSNTETTATSATPTTASATSTSSTAPAPGPVAALRSRGKKGMSSSWKQGASERYLRLVEAALDSDETGSDETTQSSDDLDEEEPASTSTTTSASTVTPTETATPATIFHTPEKAATELLPSHQTGGAGSDEDEQ